ncbi:predicted protein [Thalassiosira pseudonana CCMP1335]|uniref:DUF2256 domain-containing protein n=1 Tax=Thalassiosira pseudonana TaxID=35128 RepID=B8BYZ3_THAPS|nr:predicted protein [Thalassiosira pseudonana CCMP1335]EED92795.1 predicted protein [Thalassiosira pseudonana CCMP1335]
MPRGIKKENLPSKLCVVCDRPFTWRKKWERCWDEVTTCSKSCNRKRKEKGKASSMDEFGAALVDVQLDATFVNTGSDEVESLTAQIDNIGIRDTSDLLSAIEEDDSQYNLQHNSDDESIQSADSSNSNLDSTDPVLDAKAQRKAEKKRKKAERRAQREGRGDPTAGQKQCTICNKSVNLLIRCTYDSSEEWGMVCGKCWNDISGGVVDGDAAHPYYRYGGLWKNRRAQQST